MPLYEYRCKKCGKVFEVLQKVSDKPLAVHERCGGSLEKLISPPAFQFKGSGWYVTDYGKKGASTPPSPKKQDAKPAATESAKSSPTSKG